MKIVGNAIKISLVVLSLVFVTSINAHENGLNIDPIVACEDKAYDDYCEFYNHDGDKYRGICRTVLEDVTCVRNQPIEYVSDDGDSDADEAATEIEQVHHSH